MKGKSIPQVQGSPEWLEWRKTRIGASDAVAIAGMGFQTIGQLLDYKLGLRPPEPENEAMKRGKDMEAEARRCAEEMLDMEFWPLVVVHPEQDWRFCSLDGITMRKDAILEIKCPGAKDHTVALNDMVPVKYIPQLQHIMSVTGHEEIFYFSYRDGSGKIIRHQRDENYISKLLESETQFYSLLMKGFEAIKSHEEYLENLKNEAYRIIACRT